MISLFAVNSHFVGSVPENWSKAAQQILDEPDLCMAVEHADRMIWLDTFGDLIGNGDRHFGNFCYFAEEARHLALTPTPAYNMLPMVFAPTDANLVDRPFTPRHPTALNMHLWHEAASQAIRFWSRLCEEGGLSSDFRRLARGCRDKLSQLTEEYP